MDKTGYAPAPGANNPAWHAPDANILERAANLTWSYQTGEIISTGPGANGFASQPGILCVKEKIAFGGLGIMSPTTRQVDFAQPATVAANTLLSEMRSRTRVRNTYDAPDVALLMLAMANIYGAIFFAKRLVGTAKAFAYSNEYLPRYLFRAQSMDYNWFRDNLFDFVSELNVIISEVNKVYVPNRMHLFELVNERWSNYYTEGKEIRDQIYLFTPGILSAIDYNPTTDWAGSLVPVMIFPGKWASTTDKTKCQYDGNSLYTGEDLLSTIKYMLGMIVNHDSTADITGDFMNAFGDTERFTLPECDPTLICVPIENYEILEVIHNLKYSQAVLENFLSYNGATASNKFRTIQLPSTNEVGEYDCYTISSANEPYCNYELRPGILDVHEAPNPYKTMEITRCRNEVTAIAHESGSTYVNVSAGAELIIDVQIWLVGRTGPTSVRVFGCLPSNWTNWYTYIAARAPFHYVPLMQVIDETTGETLPNVWYIGETDIYTVLQHSNQKEMDRVSLLTLLGAYNNLK